MLRKNGDVQDIVSDIRSKISASAVIEDAYQCTPLQEGLLALSMKEQGKFMPQFIFKLPTELDMARFKEAWQVTVDSNTPLRTIFVHTRAAGLVQTVHGSEPIVWQASADLADYLRRDRALIVDFCCKTSRYAIVEDVMSASTYFVWTIHHGVLDGTSMELLLKQVDDRYRGVPPCSLTQFDRFISYILETDKQDINNYWERELADAVTEPFPRLPTTTYSPHPEQSSTRDIRIPDMLRLIATPPTVIQGAWALLIQQYTASNDVVFGIALAGRNVAVENVRGLLPLSPRTQFCIHSMVATCFLHFSSKLVTILILGLDRSTQ